MPPHSAPRLAVLAAVAAFAAVAPATAAAADLGSYGSAFSPLRPLPDVSSRWVPQGLAYWPKEDALVVSYYDCNCDADGDELSTPPMNSQIVVMKRGTRRVLSRLILPYGGHVGGLGMTKRYLWIANGEAGDGYNLHAYKASKLLTGTVSPGQGSSIRYTKRFKVRASSYLTITGSKLWAGDFENDVAYRYTIGASGRTVTQDSSASATVTTPNDTQGMAVRGGRALFSTSFGRDNPSLFVVRPLTAKSGGNTMVAPNMSEGVAIGGGGLNVVYESGSFLYHDSDLKTLTIDRSPLGKLGL